MIVPKKKLIKFFDNFRSQSVIANWLGVDETYISMFLSGKRGATDQVIDKILNGTKLSYKQAFKFQEDGDDSRED